MFKPIRICISLLEQTSPVNRDARPERLPECRLRRDRFEHHVDKMCTDSRPGRDDEPTPRIGAKLQMGTRIRFLGWDPLRIRHPLFLAHPPLSTRAASWATLGPGPGEPPLSYGAVDRSINSRDPFSEGHRVRFPRHQVVEASVASVTSPAWSRPPCS